jgi:predicted ATPase
MFKSIRLRNFKGYSDSGDVPLAPLTILIGLNNSGKSTILQGLLALSQTIQDPAQSPTLVTKGPADLNGFYDIVHGKHSSSEASFEISIRLDSPQTVRFQTGSTPQTTQDIQVPDQLSVSFTLDKKANEIEVDRSTLRLLDKTFLEIRKPATTWSSDILPASISRQTGAVFRSILPGLAMSPSATQEALSPDFVNAVTWTQISYHIWSGIFASHLHRVGPLRRRVPWQASIGARSSSELGLGGENLIAALGSGEKVPGTTKSVLQLVSDWVSKRDILQSLHLETDKGSTGRMLLADEFGGPSNINVAAMGEGISQLLPIIARSLMNTFLDCLLVEQPEIHLHPALQADLADLFIDVVKTQGRQVIVETHSEHLLMRVQRRIAEGKTITPDQVVILFVEKDGGKSKVHPLPLDKMGHFDEWPPGFFEEGYRESLELARAGLCNEFGKTAMKSFQPE